MDIFPECTNTGAFGGAELSAGGYLFTERVKKFPHGRPYVDMSVIEVFQCR